MSGKETSDAIKVLFNSFLRRYQERLETKMKGSDCIFDRVDLLEYHLHKISLNRGSSYVNSPEWLKNKRATINPKNTRDNECFKCAIIVALHHQEIGRDLQRISNLLSMIIIGKIYSFLHILRIGENLNKIIIQQAMEIIDYEKKEMIPLTNEEKESYENQKISYICEEEFSTDKKYCKVRDHYHYTEKYRGAAHSICNLCYKIPREIPTVFHNGSTYDYHFIIE